MNHTGGEKTPTKYWKITAKYLFFTTTTWQHFKQRITMSKHRSAGSRTFCLVKIISNLCQQTSKVEIKVSNDSIYLFTCSSFNKIIFKCYLKMSSGKSPFRKWLTALPLLHFLRRESKPYEDVICEETIRFTTWKWWGLGELPGKVLRSYLPTR